MLRCEIQILNKIPPNATVEEMDFSLLPSALGFGFSQKNSAWSNCDY